MDGYKLDLRRYAPAVQRNLDPILSVLPRLLPAEGLVLEVASGTGEHAVAFAQRFPALTIQPTDPDPESRESIQAWREHAPQPNLLAPLFLDASAWDWPVRAARFVICINMIHISPWESCLGLLRGAARVLPQGGGLYLYGPFRRGGLHTAPSNEDFDQRLRAQNPTWGVRDLDEVQRAAAAHDLRLAEEIAMPANNLSLLFRKEAP